MLLAQRAVEVLEGLRLTLSARNSCSRAVLVELVGTGEGDGDGVCGMQPII